MDNSYFTQVAPYFQQQDQGLSPVFQNIAQQQQNQNAALAQQNQQVQQAGQVQGGGGGMNALAMAAMLRGKQNTFGNSGMSAGMTNGGVTGNNYDNNGNLISTGNSAPSAATWNQAFGGTGGMGS